MKITAKNGNLKEIDLTNFTEVIDFISDEVEPKNEIKRILVLENSLISLEAKKRMLLTDNAGEKEIESIEERISSIKDLLSTFKSYLNFNKEYREKKDLVGNVKNKNYKVKMLTRRLERIDI